MKLIALILGVCVNSQVAPQARTAPGQAPAPGYNANQAQQQSIQQQPTSAGNQAQQQGCVMDDNVCRGIEGILKGLDPAAAVLPGIGLPSQGNGVCTITHGMPGMPNLIINGLQSKSPLANNALFSSECSGGMFLNLYEVMLPDAKSGIPGEPSAAEIYTQALSRSGLNTAGVHFHWWGTEPFVAAIHHQEVGMQPQEFIQKTVQALQIALDVIQRITPTNSNNPTSNNNNPMAISGSFQFGGQPSYNMGQRSMGQPPFGGMGQQPPFGGMGQQPPFGGMGQQPSYGGMGQQPPFGGMGQQPFGGMGQQPSFGGMGQQSSFSGMPNFGPPQASGGRGY